MNIVEKARLDLKSSSEGKRLTTGIVRSVSSKMYNTLDDKNIDNVFKLCEELLNEREWALWIIAYDWAFRLRKQYSHETFITFERWLKNYVKDWYDCDDFCTHAFGELLSQYNELFLEVIKWTEDPNFAVRRASAVILIYPIKYNRYEGIKPFLISDALMHDDHYLVLKGYGWMLKVLSQFEFSEVYNYLLKNKESMPRLSFRYALEKFDIKTKTSLINQ